MATILQEFVKDLSTLSAQRQADIGQKLANGQCGDWDEYNKQTGRAAGLRELADIAYQLMKQRDLSGDVDDSNLGEMPTSEPTPPQRRGRAKK